MILIVVTNDLTYDQRMQRICATLAAAGHGVRLVGRARKSSAPLAAQPYDQVRLRCFWEKGKAFYLEYNLRLFFYLLFHRFDAVCAVDLDTLLPAFFGAKMKGRPLVYDAHEYFTEVPEVVGRPAVKKVWEALARLLLPRIRWAYTVGPALAAALQERYGTPFAVVRNVPLAQVAGSGQAPDTEPPFFLYQGVLNEGRGLETAIRAMHFVEGAELWLAGEGDLSEALRALCRQEGLKDKVRFLGYLRPEALRALTPRAFLGLNLLENKGLNYYYSLANKFFDYLQAGVPSVNPDFPEYRAIVAHCETGWLLPELEPRALGLFLQKKLSSPVERNLLAQNCLAYREEFSWEKESGVLLEFWAEVLQDSKKRVLL